MLYCSGLGRAPRPLELARGRRELYARVDLVRSHDQDTSDSYHFKVVGKGFPMGGTAVSYTHLTLPTILRV